MVINSINNSVKRQVGTVERAWVSEKGGFNLNVPLSHYVNLEKNNNPYFIGFFHLSHKFFNRKILMYIKDLAQCYICILSCLVYLEN